MLPPYPCALLEELADSRLAHGGFSSFKIRAPSPLALCLVVFVGTFVLWARTSLEFSPRILAAGLGSTRFIPKPNRINIASRHGQPALVLTVEREEKAVWCEEPLYCISELQQLISY